PVNAGGPVLSWSIAPALPPGLAFDASSGTISGTPAAAVPLTTYEVTAANPRGSSTALLTISGE
ncbi:MAG TPA: putative Ig domain-containing protein, partial [Anaeromyxobacteraceae bacterium]|nr:putative Ig domain-containing protein [Anaeromyxobacteraceae bacterium]